MDVSNIVTQVGTAGAIVQAVQALPGGFDVPVDSSTEIFGLLDSLVSNKVHPITRKDRKVSPSIVYTLVGIESVEYDGFKIAQTDKYVLELRADSYDALITLRNNCITAFRTSAYSIEPTDMLEAWEPEDEVFHAEIEIEFSYPALGTGPIGAFSSSLPLALVYPIGRSARESDGDNYISQHMDNQYGIVIATTGDLHTALDSVQGVLLGYQQSSSYSDMEYVSGSNLGGVGTLKLWREIYTDWHVIRE